MGWIRILLLFIRGILRGRAELTAENLALRQQLAVLERRSKRPRLRKRDRIFWVWLSCFWSNWCSVLVIVQPETVVRWHQQGFKLYWRWKSRSRKPGRPPFDGPPKRHPVSRRANLLPPTARHRRKVRNSLTAEQLQQPPPRNMLTACYPAAPDQAPSLAGV